MCPLCISAAALIYSGATATGAGGLSALYLAKRAARGTPPIRGGRRQAQPPHDSIVGRPSAQSSGAAPLKPSPPSPA